MFTFFGLYAARSLAPIPLADRMLEPGPAVRFARRAVAGRQGVSKKHHHGKLIGRHPPHGPDPCARRSDLHGPILGPAPMTFRHQSMSCETLMTIIVASQHNGAFRAASRGAARRKPDA